MTRPGRVTLSARDDAYLLLLIIALKGLKDDDYLR
jgi:hypothetical protein